MRCGLFCLAYTGFSVAVFGATLVILFPFMYDVIFESLMKVYPGSLSYDIWKEIPIPMYMSVYYWNVTNYHDIEARVPGVKPILEEVGPYVFKEEHFKVNETWDNSTVTYYQIKQWHFEESMSAGSMEDEVVSINMIAVSAAEYARYREDFYTTELNDLINLVEESGLFLRATVKEWTFDGILDGILGSEFPDFLYLPIPFDRFGWFYPRNNSATYDHDFTMWTGMDVFEDVGQIYKWNGAETIPREIYTGSCAEMTGSAGDFFPPERDETFIDYFTPDLCRTIRFNYKGETEVRGIPGFEFALDELFYSNSTYEPSNACYNPYPAEETHLPNGLLNVSSCKFDSPAYVSFPHFMNVDPELTVDRFPEDTFRPDPEKHKNYVSLEPGSGIPLEVGIRLQINGFVRPLQILSQEDDTNIAVIDFLEDLEPTYFPLLWFDTIASLDSDLEDDIHLMLVVEKSIPGVGWALVAAGIVAGSTGVILAVRQRRRWRRLSPSEKVWLVEDEEEEEAARAQRQGN